MATRMEVASICGEADRYTASCQSPAAAPVPPFVTVHVTFTSPPGAALAGVNVTLLVARSASRYNSPTSTPEAIGVPAVIGIEYDPDATGNVRTFPVCGTIATR